MMICTIVESLVFTLVKEETVRKGVPVARKNELKQIHQIPQAVLGRDDVVIAQKVIKELHIDKDDISFRDLNHFLKNNGVITQLEYRQLEYVRTERNRLHLQSLTVPDTGYTKQKVMRVLQPLDFLADKL